MADDQLAEVDLAEATEVGEALRRASPRSPTEIDADGLEPVLGVGSDLAHERVGDRRLADEQHPDRARRT